MQLVTKCNQCYHTSSLQGDSNKSLRCTVCNFTRPALKSDLPVHLQPRTVARRNERVASY
jgi:hypothetical protein